MTDLDKRLEDLLYDLGSTLFCLGQDWTKGDGSASQVDVIVDKTKAALKSLMAEARIKEVQRFARKYRPTRKPIKESPMELTTEATVYCRVAEDIIKYEEIRVAELQRLQTNKVKE